MIRLGLFLTVLLYWSQSFCEVQAQEQARDSTSLRVHRTTVASAFLPGAGQIANRQWWKAPVVWAGMAWSIQQIKLNTDTMWYFRDALILETDGDSLTVNSTGLSQYILESNAQTARYNRDVSYMILIGIHLLQILDANVSAHLRTFDVSDDLSLEWGGMRSAGSGMIPCLTMRWSPSVNNKPEPFPW
jgi:hypothetical protein